MKYPHIKKTVKVQGNFPIMVGESIKFLEDTRSRSLPFDGKVTMVGYPNDDTVKVTIDTKLRTIIVTYSADQADDVPHAQTAEMYDKETGYMTMLPDFGIVGVSVQHGFFSTKPIRYVFTRLMREQYTIGYEHFSEQKKLAPLQIGDTFKSRAGNANKEYQVDWIASDGAVVVHRIDGFSSVEIQKRKNNGTYDPDEKRPFESLLFRANDRSFWSKVDGFEYAELVSK